ncbi:hypothetical protein GGX14DRAFT_385891 [Mycena pura]|uniref:Uncharacterized protein n=1 Tax=Mycena pura TaxID=153505 RepID=A0AAD7E4I4_9AGAR|nr:hypothetical protein GGX14DRAFT_385891 [Mycena pura]
MTPSSQENVSMADLVLAYNQASDSGWSLFSRTRRIVKKSLNKWDVTNRGEDSVPPYLGQFGLEQPLFLSVESTVLEMQRLLSAAFSFVNGCPICFIVDPHGVLLAILRGASCIEALQVAWKSRRERIEIARRRFVEYHADYVAQTTSAPLGASTLVPSKLSAVLADTGLQKLVPT